MAQRSAFQVQILEKIGAPLMAAVSDVAARQEEGSDSSRQEAERVAELLGKTVQAGVALAASMGLKDSDGQSDSIRLALAALAGPLVAGQYRHTGKVPGDNDIKRMVKALEAVLTFADNFAPAAETTARLESLRPGAFADENQVSIQYVNALVPVVNAIAGFSFGRPENKLVQEVADRLVARAASIAARVVGATPASANKRAELGILSGLATLYVECHQEETRRLLAMNEEERAKVSEMSGGVLPLDPVWKAFDGRAAMIELVASVAVPGGQTAASGDSAGPQPVQEEQPPVAAPVLTARRPEAAPAPEEESAAQEDQAGEEDKGAYNPMGFFSAKKSSSAGEGRA